MSNVYGTIVRKSEIEDSLRSENVWKDSYVNENYDSYRNVLSRGLFDTYSRIDSEIAELINEAKISGDKQIDTLRSSVNRNILSNYVDMFDERAKVMRSNLGQGYKDEAIGDLDRSLERAYESYLLNYKQNKEDINSQLDATIAAYEKQREALKEQAASNMESELNEIDRMEAEAIKYNSSLNNIIGEEAENYVNYYGSISNYVDWLFNESGVSDDLFNQSAWQDLFMNENGYMGSGSLTASMFDDDGYLTDTGREIINFIMSNPISQTVDSEGRYMTGYDFDTYLADTDKELANWLMDTSMYSTEDDYMDNRTYALRMLGYNDDYRTPSNITRARKFNDSNPDKSKVVPGKGITTNYYRNPQVGEVAVYDGGNIVAFEEFTLSSDKTINDRDGESFRVTYEDDTGRKHSYNLELANSDVENSVLNESSPVYRKIRYNVGKITENKIYSYGNDIYVGVNKNGEVILRKLQGNAGDKGYKNLHEFIESKNWGNNYNFGWLNSGTKISDGSKVDKDNEEILRRNREHNMNPSNGKPGYIWDFETGTYKKIVNFNPRARVGK